MTEPVLSRPQSYYHILHRMPALEGDELFAEQEMLARQLAASGQMRIDLGDKANFLPLALPSSRIERSFSIRELTDSALIPRTLEHIAAALRPREPHPDAAARQELARLQRALGKLIPVTAEEEIKLARIIVQSAHPAVILLLLWEGVEIFVTGGHTVGEVMDIPNWQSFGSSSGLQSTGHKGDYTIYISAGGNPFLPEDYHGMGRNGRYAIARMMIIGGQELGHYADIIRNASGRPVNRHSADLGGRRASPKCRAARNKDIDILAALSRRAWQLGLKRLLDAEEDWQFFARHQPGSRRMKAARRKAKWRLWWYLRLCRMANLRPLLCLREETYKATQIKMFLEDMGFNLAPVADAYQRDDPLEEEAVACMEALARVPQQVNKWGHDAVRLGWPHLYKLYYAEVTPACIRSWEQLTGQTYRFRFTPPRLGPVATLRKLRRTWKMRLPGQQAHPSILIP